MTKLVIVGGFLGAGKTTLMLQAANHLKAKGYRVGLITNDQGDDLVDTALLERQGFAVNEVAGGCFCCRFPDLLKALAQLQEVQNPDIILAEPVGSCTDLAATVLQPLAKYYPNLQLAALSIVFDPLRDISRFNRQVTYLFEQQLSEAQIILLNKVDVLAETQRHEALELLASQYSGAHILSVSALTGEGLEPWLDLVLGVMQAETKTLDLDYQRYAEAEAALAWLNAKGVVTNDERFSPVAWLEAIFVSLRQTFKQDESAIAHIKVQVTAEKVYKASLTGLESSLTWDSKPEDNVVEQLAFVLNSRVNTSPQRLEQAVLYALETAQPQFGARFYFSDFACFQPAPPKPTYRFLKT